MNVHMYFTMGGKNLIHAYLDKLPERESVEGYLIINRLELEGLSFLEN